MQAVLTTQQNIICTEPLGFEKQFLLIKSELDSLAAVPAGGGFDRPSRENRGSLTLQRETNQVSGSRQEPRERPLFRH